VEEQEQFEVSQRTQAVEVPMELIEAAEWNPNRQKDEVFNATVSNIQEIGFVEPIMIAPLGNGRFRIVSGHHRYEAMKILGETTVPAIIKEFDEDMQKFQTVRMNMLRGKMDPVKFTKLFREMAEKYGEELTKQAMGAVDPKVLKGLIIQVASELPAEMKERLENAKDDIKTVDDLSRILNEMFSTYGDTLKNSFMVFSYGGKPHYWILMNKELKKIVDGMAKEAKTNDLDINDLILKRLLSGGADEGADEEDE
jgi:ParB/RepB/Spo0J family partition protein